MLWKRVISGIVCFVGVAYIGLSLMIPVAWWVLVIPGILMIFFQWIAWHGPKGAIIAGDFMYYLGIGGAVGIAGIVVDNSAELSRLFANNEARELHRAFVSAQRQFDEISNNVETNSRKIQRVAVRIGDAKHEPMTDVNQDVLSACLAEQIIQNNEDIFRTDRRDSFLTAPLRDQFVSDACSWIANPRRTVDIARDDLAILEEQKDDLEAEFIIAKRALDEAQAALDDERSQWISITEDVRNWLVLELFPCLLLAGVASKLGKVADSIKPKQVGK